MYFASVTLATVLLAVQPALADFFIFTGAENQFPDPAQATIVLFFNNPPSCKDVTSKAIQWTISPNNDASFDGVACDGCDGSKAPQDWDVKRFEIHDRKAGTFDNAGSEPHFTLYKDDKSGGWGLYDVDMKVLGACTRPDPVQIANCPDVFSADSVAGIIHCNAPMTIKNSN